MAGHQPNKSKVEQRKRFNAMHKEGRKLFSVNKKIKRVSSKIDSLQLELDQLKKKQQSLTK